MSSSSRNLFRNDTTSQQGMLCEIEYSIESLKLKMLERLDAIKESSIKHIHESDKKVKEDDKVDHFNIEAFKAFERSFNREIASLRYELGNTGKHFEPHVSRTMEVTANIGFNYGANTYNQKHNLIISCPSNSYVHFYDATTLKPMKQRKRKQISSSVVQMSYCPETDTHIMGCAFGDVYAYNASKNDLTKVAKQGDSFILAITYLDANTFVFSSSKSGSLYIGNLKTGRTLPHYSLNSDAWYLHHNKEQGLLMSGLASGKVAIYNTRKGSKYPIVDSLQAHKFGKYVTLITNIKVNGKEYVLTAGNDHTIKVWHFIKGKMRMLKVIHTAEDVSTIVYLEDYKMIASTHHRDYIRFFKVPFGKVEATLNLGLTKSRNIFLMKDKNCVGVADLAMNVIKIVQLHSNQPQSQ